MRTKLYNLELIANEYEVNVNHSFEKIAVFDNGYTGCNSFDDFVDDLCDRLNAIDGQSYDEFNIYDADTNNFIKQISTVYNVCAFLVAFEKNITAFAFHYDSDDKLNSLRVHQRKKNEVHKFLIKPCKY